MNKLGDIARITPLNKSIAADLPDVDDIKALQASAELVHSFLRTKITAVSIARTRDGRPGREWQGRILFEIIYKLWPRLNDRVLVTPEDARLRSGAILDYMIRCGIICCIRKTYDDVPAKWWVSDNFTPMTVSNVNDRETEEQVSEETEEADSEMTEIPEADGTYPCREPECDKSFTNATGRSGHEYNVHNMVSNADGERFYYAAGDFTPQYIVSEIVSVLNEVEKPLTFYGICSRTYARDPRLGKPIIRDHLADMVTANALIKSERGAYTYYAVASGDQLSGPIAGLLDAVAEARQVRSEAKEEAKAAAVETSRAPVPTDLKSGIAYAKHVTSTALGGMKAVLDTMEELAAYAAEKDREIAGLKQRLMAAPKASDKEKELEEELAKVKVERDLYKGKVEAFESALRGLRTS